jgi:hypothetical protein
VQSTHPARNSPPSAAQPLLPNEPKTRSTPGLEADSHRKWCILVAPEIHRCPPSAAVRCTASALASAWGPGRACLVLTNGRRLLRRHQAHRVAGCDRPARQMVGAARTHRCRSGRAADWPARRSASAASAAACPPGHRHDVALGSETATSRTAGSPRDRESPRKLTESMARSSERRSAGVGGRGRA